MVQKYYLFGCGILLNSGFIRSYPLGNFDAIASSFMAGTIITRSPSFQFAGVATL